MTTHATSFVLGLDLGQVNDFTALAALERSYEPDQHQPQRTVSHYTVRGLKRWRGVSYVDLAAAVKEQVQNPPLRGSPVAVDQTGVGRAVVDLLRVAGLPVVIHAITITAGSSITIDPASLEAHVPKKELVSTLALLLQGGRLRISRQSAEAETLKAELAAFRVKVTAAANETFGSWREQDHDDLVLAVAMACWLGERTPGPYCVGLPQKGKGDAVSRLPPDVFARRDGRDPLPGQW